VTIPLVESARGFRFDQVTPTGEVGVFCVQAKKERREMNKKIHFGIVTLITLAILLTVSPFQEVGLAATAKEAAVSNALLWLRTQQQPDGSIPSAVSGTYNGTTQAVLAIVAGNQDPHAWLSSNNQSPMDYLASEADTQTDDITETGTTARLTLAVVAAGNSYNFGRVISAAGGIPDDPYDFGGVNLVERLQGYYNPSTGQYGPSGDVPAQALAMMALSVAVTETQSIDQTVPTAATDLLKSWQDPGGGWGYVYPCNPEDWCYPDADNTALAIQALIAAGEPTTSVSIVNALNFLKSQQGDDGGFQAWGTSNANSTAWGIQAVLAADQDPEGPDWTKDGHTPVSFLLSLQDDTGYFEYSDPPPGWSADLALTTMQAAPALAGKPFPLRGRYIAVKKGLRWLQTQQQADGSIPSAFGTYNATNQAVLAIVAGEEDPLAWDSSSPGNPDPIDYLKSQAPTETATVIQTSSCALTILSAQASGQDPTDFSGVDLINTLTTTDYNSSTGQYGSAGSVPDQAWSILALKAVGETIPVAAADLLKGWQDAGGGWGYVYPCNPEDWCYPDADNTALALQALIAAGEPATSASVVNALNFLKSQQGDDGGFQAWGTSNANSTAWSTQALIAALEDPQGANWSQDSKTPWTYLLQLQADTGYFEYSDPPPGWPADLVLTTIQAIPALAGKPFPYLDEMWIGKAQVEVNPLNGDFYVTAPYAQDLNSNSAVQVRYQPTGDGKINTSWTGWQDMTCVRTHAGTAFASTVFARTVSGLDPGSYEFEFQFADSNGTAQGEPSQTVEVSWSAQGPQVANYFPLIFKNWSQ
jgi:hypothetical protein